MVNRQADPAPGPYYVSMVDGERMALLAGPFKTHAEALTLVDRAAVDAPGKLNARLGVVV